MLAAAFAGWASGTAPFGVAAYTAVSVPALLLVGALVGERLMPARGPWQVRPVPVEHPSEGRSSAVWIGLVALALAVELASYFHPGPRSLYPTFSSIADDVLAHRPLEAAAFLGWLVGGWYLVTR